MSSMFHLSGAWFLQRAGAMGCLLGAGTSALKGHPTPRFPVKKRPQRPINDALLNAPIYNNGRMAILAG